MLQLRDLKGTLTKVMLNPHEPESDLFLTCMMGDITQKVNAGGSKMKKEEV